MTSSRPARITSPTRPTGLDGRWSHLDRQERGLPARRNRDQARDHGRDRHRADPYPRGLPAAPHRGAAAGGRRRRCFRPARGFDWATGEALAFGSLLTEGYPVRLSGAGRHPRHPSASAIPASSTRRPRNATTRWNHIRSEGQSQYEVIDLDAQRICPCSASNTVSLWPSPTRWTLWERRNSAISPTAAQIMFDQFISSGESKWLRMSGLVVLLPHGFEGQGPEHSSARLERFLQMCGGDNWIVANCTTPANYFHILRRQLHRSFRKPLILMTPKSLLRHKLAISGGRGFHHRVELPPGAVGRCPEGQFRHQAGQGQGHQACGDVFRQGLLRPAGRTRRARHRRYLPSQDRTVLSVPGDEPWSRSWNASRGPR